MDSTPFLASPALICWLGAALGAVFGCLTHRTHFCTMGAVADIVGMGAWTRMRQWAMAVGIAILVVTALRLKGVIFLEGTAGLAPRLLWLSHLVGGLLFGAGMVLAGGCGSKTLVRLGGGNLKSVVVILVVGLTASMTLRGLLAVPRTRWLDAAAITLPVPQDLGSLLALLSGSSTATVLPIVGGVVGLALLAWALKEAEARQPMSLLAGLGVGLVVVAGWLITAHLGHVAEHPETLQEAWIATNSGRAESLSFVGPQAFGLQLLMLWTDANTVLTFGIATALGVVAGAAADALISGQWRLEAFRSKEDLVHHLLGAVLMGFGGITAVGCSIGQGLSGLSLLSLGAVITTAAIITGAWLTLKWQEARV